MSNLSGLSLAEGEEARIVALPSQSVASVTMPSARPAVTHRSPLPAASESAQPRTSVPKAPMSTVQTAATFTIFGFNPNMNPRASLSDFFSIPTAREARAAKSVRRSSARTTNPSWKTQTLLTHPEALQSNANTLVHRSSQPASRSDDICQVFTAEDIKTLVEHACEAALPYESMDRSQNHYEDCLDRKTSAWENNRAVPGVLVFAQTFALSIVESMETKLEYQWLGTVMEKLAWPDKLQAYAQELQDKIGGGFVRSEGFSSVIKRSIERRIQGHFCDNGYQKGRDDLNRIFLALKKFVRDKLMPSLFSSHGFIVDDHLIPQFDGKFKEALESLKDVLDDVLHDQLDFEAAYFADMGVNILPRIDVVPILEHDLGKWLVR